MAAFGDGDAVFALAARLNRRLARAIGADTVHALGNDTRCGRLADAANAGHHKGLRDPVAFKRVFQGADHGLLPDQIGETFGPVFARQNLIGFFGALGHAVP